jgi:hypothetical protein
MLGCLTTSSSFLQREKLHASIVHPTGQVYHYVSINHVRSSLISIWCLVLNIYLIEVDYCTTTTSSRVVGTKSTWYLATQRDRQTQFQKSHGCCKKQYTCATTTESCSQGYSLIELERRADPSEADQHWAPPVVSETRHIFSRSRILVREVSLLIEIEVDISLVSCAASSTRRTQGLADSSSNF